MGSTQQILSAGALVILTLLILTATKDSNIRYETKYSTDAITIGTSVGQTILGQIQSMAFDELTIGAKITDSDSLTTSFNLGSELGEYTSSLYDDIDDFNNYSKVDSSHDIGKFTIDVSVYYVHSSYPETKSSMRTFCKKIDVSVNNDYLPTPVQLSQIVSY